MQFRPDFNNAANCGDTVAPMRPIKGAIDAKIGQLRAELTANKKPSGRTEGLENWVQGLDLNQRPSGYEGVM